MLKLIASIVMLFSFYAYGMNAEKKYYETTFVHEDGRKEILTSRYRSKNLNELTINLKQLTIPVERTFICINPTIGESALLTPVSPCVAVIGRHKSTNFLCILHVFFPNKVDEIPTILRQQLFEKKNIRYNSQDIAVTLFSKKVHEEIYKKDWLKNHQGKSQREQINYIQSTIIKKLELSQDAIDVYYLETGIKTCIAEAFAETIVVNGDTDNVGKLCLYHTNPYIPSGIPTPEKIYEYHYALTENRYGERCSPYHPENIYQYDSVEFTESPKNNLYAIINTQIPKRDYGKSIINNPYSYLNLKVRIKNKLRPLPTNKLISIVTVVLFAYFLRRLPKTIFPFKLWQLQST